MTTIDTRLTAESTDAYRALLLAEAREMGARDRAKGLALQAFEDWRDFDSAIIDAYVSGYDPDGTIV